jgi:hypothetical protein
LFPSCHSLLQSLEVELYQPIVFLTYFLERIIAGKEKKEERERERERDKREDRAKRERKREMTFSKYRDQFQQ